MSIHVEELLSTATVKTEVATTQDETCGPGPGASCLSIEEAWRLMRDSWAEGRAIHAEEIFARFPLASNQGSAVDIIYADYALASEYRQAPSPQQYVVRFPRFADALDRQLALHGLIVDDTQAFDHSLRERVEREPATGLTCPGPFGDYYLLSSLDEGGQAIVYRGLHSRLAYEVVIKVAKERIASTSETASRIFHEGQLLAGLSHPNLVRVIDAGVWNGYAFLVMEYVRGRTLAQYRAQTEMSPSDAAILISKLARALAVVQGVGVVHCDIKPKNILVDPSGDPRLIDFGLSRLQDVWTTEAPGEQQLTGTPQYMAPEQARCRAASDVFSLTGVLFFLLTKTAPISGNSLAEQLENARAGHWQSHLLDQETIPEALKAICRKGLAECVEDRFGGPAALADALDRFIASQTTTTAPRISRRMVATWIASAGVVGLLLCGLLSAIRHQPPVKRFPLEVLVWEDDRTFSRLNDVVPLHEGDRVRLNVTVPAGCYVSFFLLSRDGKFRRLHDVSPAATDRQASFPQGVREVVPLTGGQCTECIVYCVTRGRPLPTAELDAAFHAATFPLLPESAVVRTTSERVYEEQKSRDFGASEQLATATSDVVRRLEGVRLVLRDKCEYFEAILFRHDN